MYFQKTQQKWLERSRWSYSPGAKLSPKAALPDGFGAAQADGPVTIRIGRFTVRRNTGISRACSRREAASGIGMVHFPTGSAQKAFAIPFTGCAKAFFVCIDVQPVRRAEPYSYSSVISSR